MNWLVYYLMILTIFGGLFVHSLVNGYFLFAIIDIGIMWFAAVSINDYLIDLSTYTAKQVVKKS